MIKVIITPVMADFCTFKETHKEKIVKVFGLTVYKKTIKNPITQYR